MAEEDDSEKPDAVALNEAQRDPTAASRAARYFEKQTEFLEFEMEHTRTSSATSRPIEGEIKSLMSGKSRFES